MHADNFIIMPKIISLDCIIALHNELIWIMKRILWNDLKFQVFKSKYTIQERQRVEDVFLHLDLKVYFWLRFLLCDIIVSFCSHFLSKVEISEHKGWQTTILPHSEQGEIVCAKKGAKIKETMSLSSQQYTLRLVVGGTGSLQLQAITILNLNLHWQKPPQWF